MASTKKRPAKMSAPVGCPCGRVLQVTLMEATKAGDVGAFVYVIKQPK